VFAIEIVVLCLTSRWFNSLAELTLESVVLAFSEKFRKATTLVLAVFLWLHALFLLNFQATLLSKIAHFVRLSFSEALLVVLLIIFSFLAASGPWKTILSLAYIYFFPFVLLGYVFYLFFLALRAINSWLKAQSNPLPYSALVIEQNATTAGPVLTVASANVQATRTAGAEIFHFSLQPFRHFMLIWCLLLLVTSHVEIIWLCLVVVLVQLGRKIWVILKVLLFPKPWLDRLGPALLIGFTTALDKLATVTLDAAPSNELQSLWNQLHLWRSILDFLKNPYLLSRWAWLLGSIFLGLIYVYIAVLFSFAYYGIAHVNGVSYSWPDALLASLFIPFFVTELPKIFWLRVLGGIQCVLVIAISVGTIVNFLRRKLDAVRRAATDFSDRFADQSIHEKYLILEERFSTPSKPATSAGNTQT
jgi:hypothetical protein